MDTTKLVYDTVAVNFSGMKDAYLPCVKESITNWYDVVIVAMICTVVGYLIRYAIKKHFEYKKQEFDFSKENASNSIVPLKQDELPVERKERENKQEQQRKDRAKALFKEICNISKEADSINFDIVHELLELYIQIDKYDKNAIEPTTTKDET